MTHPNKPTPITRSELRDYIDELLPLCESFIGSLEILRDAPTYDEDYKVARFPKLERQLFERLKGLLTEADLLAEDAMR